MKIARIRINSFRGIPDECEMNFVDKQGKAVSAIIYGCNGSGKSSIVDAIEYCLQAKIERKETLNNPRRPSLINYASSWNNNPKTEITFEDGSKQVREVDVAIDEDTGSHHLIGRDKMMNPAFSMAPIVLRRNDIISYNITKEAERQILMLQFMYKEDLGSVLDSDPKVLELERKAINVRRERDGYIEKISKILDVPFEDAKENATNIEQYIRERFSPIGQKIGISQSGKIKKHIPSDKFNEAIGLAEQCNLVNKKNKRIKDEKKRIRAIKDSTKFKNLEGFYDKVSEYLTSAFKEISNANYIEDIKLSLAYISDTSMTIRIKLSNGITVEPNQIFSEANFDLMVLLLYISIIRVCVERGQEKVLVLDDVLQSVDADIRAKFIVYLLREFYDWQLFITCHDRLWLNQLKYLFNNVSHKFKEYRISGWTYTSGPNIHEGNNYSIDTTLKKAIETGDVRIIAAVSGLFLEKICQELSVTLRCSIERKKDDKYTIGDLWPSIKKNLKKTQLRLITEKIDRLLCIRNLLGCHYNQWADSFSDEEVLDFANSVQELYESCFCDKCFSWIQKAENSNIVCQCHKLTY